METMTMIPNMIPSLALTPVVTTPAFVALPCATPVLPTTAVMGVSGHGVAAGDVRGTDAQWLRAISRKRFLGFANASGSQSSSPPI